MNQPAAEQNPYEKFSETPVDDNSLAVCRQLAEEQMSAERKVADCETALAKAQDDLRQIAEKRLPELLDQLRMKDFSLQDGSRISLEETVRVNVSEANREKAIAWAESIGKGGVVKREVTFRFGKGDEEKADKVIAAAKTVDPKLKGEVKKKIEGSTMRATVVEALEQGVDVPDSISIHRQRRTEITPPK